MHRQGSICTELISRMSEHGAQLARAVSFAAEVDCLIALAAAARDYNLTRPVLTRDNVLDIRQGAGRHSTPCIRVQICTCVIMPCLKLCPACCHLLERILPKATAAHAASSYGSNDYPPSPCAKHHETDAGRHPLTERVVDLFVPNDTVMGRTNDRIQVSGSATSPAAALRVHPNQIACRP